MCLKDLLWKNCIFTRSTCSKELYVNPVLVINESYQLLWKDHVRLVIKYAELKSQENTRSQKLLAPSALVTEVINLDMDQST